MKCATLTISLVCLVLFWAGSALAVDKTKKDKVPPKEKAVEVEKKPEAKQDRSGIDKPDNNSSRSKKNYDNFIDNNNNGIDDRAEKKTSVKKVKKDTTSTAPSPSNP